jgi:transposase
MIQDLIQRHFGVAYHPHYLATLLKNLGFSYHNGPDKNQAAIAP